jgi:membrane protein YqaA with SNARE-associated domain
MGESTMSRLRAPAEPDPTSTFIQRQRVTLILAELGIVLALLLTWYLSEEVRASTSLWVLFFYSFPSEFLVGLIPHEPILVLYGGYHAPWIVALVSVVSTTMAEGLNYHFFSLFVGVPALNSALNGKTVKRMGDLFKRWPFLAILVAGATPVPFFPIRFLVVITEYPVQKYLLGVFLSRGPRFLVLAMLGKAFEIPPMAILGLFVAMLVLINIPTVAKVLADSRAGAD